MWTRKHRPDFPEPSADRLSEEMSKGCYLRFRPPTSSTSFALKPEPSSGACLELKRIPQCPRRKGYTKLPLWMWYSFGGELFSKRRMREHLWALCVPLKTRRWLITRRRSKEKKKRNESCLTEPAELGSFAFVRRRIFWNNRIYRQYTVSSLKL